MSVDEVATDARSVEVATDEMVRTGLTQLAASLQRQIDNDGSPELVDRLISVLNQLREPTLPEIRKAIDSHVKVFQMLDSKVNSLQNAIQFQKRGAVAKPAPRNLNDILGSLK